LCRSENLSLIIGEESLASVFEKKLIIMFGTQMENATASRRKLPNGKVYYLYPVAKSHRHI
jgi:hypothetical protein